MYKLSVFAAAMSALFATNAALAQSDTSQANQPATEMQKPIESTGEAATDKGAATATEQSSQSSAGLMLPEAEAEKWIGEAAYSSDDENVGEVAAFVRSADGTISEVHLDIGGFLGLGETRVNVAPEKVSIEGNKMVIDLTSDEISELPKVEKTN